jgi:hypothetical protein
MPLCMADAFQDPECGIYGDTFWLGRRREAVWQRHQRGEAAVLSRAGDVQRTKGYSCLLCDTQTILSTLSCFLCSLCLDIVQEVFSVHNKVLLL